MEREAIVERLKEFLSKDYTAEINTEFNDLVQKFHAQTEKVSEALNEEIEELSEEVEASVDELAENFKEMVNSFKTKRDQYFEKKNLEEASNLSEKKKIIEELKDLIQKEENIGTGFTKIKEIRERWNEIGAVNKNERDAIQKSYSNLVEEFYYNINIYKALQENDLKRNYQRKKDVITSLQNLLSEEKIKVVEGELRFLQNEWEDIGPTLQDKWEEVKKEYWDTVKKIYDKIKAYYEKRREESVKNIEIKAALIKKLEGFIDNMPINHKQWDKLTSRVVELQNEWKKTGFGPREENEKLWKQFRQHCDTFFDAKREYYKERNQDFVKVKEAKEALIKEVETLKASTEWKKAADKIKNIQNKWKNLGNAGPRYEQKLWKSFRSHCDEFFNAKQKHFEDQDNANTENLKAKEAVIIELDAFSVDGLEAKVAILELKKFSDKFNAIGNVPFKEKDRIYKSFKDAMDKLYGQLKIDAAEKEKIIFESRLASIMASDQKDELLTKERIKVRKKMDKIKEEIIQYENNLGFFGKTTRDNPLVKDVYKKIDQAKAELEKLKTTLKNIPKP